MKFNLPYTTSVCEVGSNAYGHNENKWEGSVVLCVVAVAYVKRNPNFIVLEVFEGNELC